jgi:hypothetical protein
MGAHPLKMAIEYLEQLMDEEEERRGKQAWRAKGSFHSAAKKSCRVPQRLKPH